MQVRMHSAGAGLASGCSMQAGAAISELRWCTARNAVQACVRCILLYVLLDASNASNRRGCKPDFLMQVLLRVRTQRLVDAGRHLSCVRLRSCIDITGTFSAPMAMGACSACVAICGILQHASVSFPGQSGKLTSTSHPKPYIAGLWATPRRHH